MYLNKDITEYLYISREPRVRFIKPVKEFGKHFFSLSFKVQDATTRADCSPFLNAMAPLKYQGTDAG